MHNYLTNTTGERPGKDALNASRRACPDLSVYDSGFYIIQDGSPSPIGGTSAAAGLWVALLHFSGRGALGAAVRGERRVACVLIMK